jgi:hypothetical protein
MDHLNVIFVSALRDQTGSDLPALLEEHAACSHLTSVCSMLLFSDGNVMQAMDGEASEIRCELKRLFQSPFLRDAIVLNEELVNSPSLEGHSLGAQHLTASVLDQLPANVAFFKLSEGAVAQRVRSGIARNLLKQFAADYS